MASVIKSISLSLDENDFINDFNLSPSQLIKEKIWELKGMIKSVAQKKIEGLVTELENQCRIREKVEKNYDELLKKYKNVLEQKKPTGKR